MKPCIGCKYLRGTGSVRWCAVDRKDAEYVRVVSPLTGAVSYYDSRYPDRLRLPSPEEQRANNGRCGPDRKLYEPSLWVRIFPWAHGAE